MAGDIVTCTKANLIGFKKRGVVTAVSELSGTTYYRIKWPAYTEPLVLYREMELELLSSPRIFAQEAAEYDYITNLPRPE